MFTCKMKSGQDFQGREALEQLKEVGSHKKKVCFTLDSDDSCLLGLETIYRDGEVVGHVRRADYAFHLDKPVAYG